MTQNSRSLLEHRIRARGRLLPRTVSLFLLASRNLRVSFLVFLFSVFVVGPLFRFCF